MERPQSPLLSLTFLYGKSQTVHSSHFIEKNNLLACKFAGLGKATYLEKGI